MTLTKGGGIIGIILVDDVGIKFYHWRKKIQHQDLFGRKKMKKLILVIILLVGNLLNAKYIPYKELKNYTFSMQSGYRADSEDNKIIVNIENGYPSVPISKRLYNELSQHNDYKNHFDISEWTSTKSKAKSYKYNLVLPTEVLSNIPHQKGMMAYYIDSKGSKICKGTSIIDEGGFIWCTANFLKDLLVDE